MFDFIKKLTTSKEKKANRLEAAMGAKLPFDECMKLLLDGDRYHEKKARRVVYEENQKEFLKWKSGDSTVDLGDYQTFLDGAKIYKERYSVENQGIRYESTQTGCINADCIGVAECLLAQGYNPAILNLASAKHPGGGYHDGCGAQEESLCRCSNLILSLYQFGNPERMRCVAASGVPVKSVEYPLDRNFGGVYTPKVTFFRHNRPEFYALRDKVFQCDVITVAALSFTGRADYSGEYETRFRSETGGFTAEGEEIMLNKIRTIFRMGVEHGKDALVLGAFGCGAYLLPVPDVVALFERVIQEPEFAGKFRLLVFAILENERTEKDKFIEFYRAFGTFKMP